MQSVSELMTAAPLVTVRPDATVAEAARVIADHGVSHLLVTLRDKLVGVVCICDLDAAPQSASVAEHMSARPLTVEPDATAAATAERMRSSGVSCMPVVLRGALEGVVTLSDLQRGGYATEIEHRCAACGSDDHVRTHEHMQVVGFCIECRRSSQPPRWDDDLGGG